MVKFVNNLVIYITCRQWGEFSFHLFNRMEILYVLSICRLARAGKLNRNNIGVHTKMPMI